MAAQVVFLLRVPCNDSGNVTSLRQPAPGRSRKNFTQVFETGDSSKESWDLKWLVPLVTPDEVVWKP